MTAQTLHADAASPIGRLLRIKDVEAETSLSRATIYRRIAEGEFPAPIRLTTQRVAWSQTAIERWKSEQLAACTT